ncbi:MAG: hypothetical protein RR986_07810 [Longicatena sp.]
MKVVLISCFGHYEQRIKFVKEAFEAKGDEVTIIFSDFDHINKTKVQNEMEGIEYIHVKPYYKNISIARIVSHYIFAKKMYKRMLSEEPDLIYAIIPPNFICRFLKKYKEKSNVKLIFDIYDLWPESFTNKRIEKIAFPIFNYWRSLRNNSLNSADYIITECDLYQDYLKEIIKDVNSMTLYLTKQSDHKNEHSNNSLDAIHVCYLGSINNIINIDLIKKTLFSLNKIKPVILEIIGKGESKDYFINEIENLGIAIIDHGPLYGKEKNEVLGRCHFGINMMVDSVKVGLTMKSIDYFEAGLPLLNNIKGDTWNIVETQKIGFNISSNSIDENTYKIANLSSKEYEAMNKNVNEVFADCFSVEVFNRKFTEIYSVLTNK